MKSTEAFDFEGEYGNDYHDFVQRVIPGYHAFFTMGLAVLQTRLPAAARLLVVGSGSGSEVLTFGQACPEWTFTAVDPSRQMIDTARQAAATAGLTSRVRFHQGYCWDLPVETTYDAATLINVMHFLPDDGAKQALLDAVAARLKDGGTFLLFDLHGDTAAPAFGRLLGAWERFMALQGFSPQERAVFMDRLERGIDYVPEERIIELARAAGLRLGERYGAGLLYGGWVFEKTALP